jgi:FMN phosphatase YigB (HAD superfamily)
MKSVKYILLDLGGVLYGVDYGLTLQGLGLSAEALPALLQDPTLAAYEKGELSTEAFLQGWKSRFPHLTERDLIDAWNAMLLGPLPEAERSPPDPRLFLLPRPAKQYERPAPHDCRTPYCALAEVFCGSLFFQPHFSAQA